MFGGGDYRRIGVSGCGFGDYETAWAAERVCFDEISPKSCMTRSFCRVEVLILAKRRLARNARFSDWKCDFWRWSNETPVVET